MLSTEDARIIGSAFWEDVSGDEKQRIFRRIKRLPEPHQKVVELHSGTTVEGRRILLEKFEEHSPALLLSMQRRPASRGSEGGVDHATCHGCGFQDTLQKVAQHLVCRHFELKLWRCTEVHQNCLVCCARRSDFDRHREKHHSILTPRKQNKQNKLQRRNRENTPSVVPSANVVSPYPGTSMFPSTSSRLSFQPMLNSDSYFYRDEAPVGNAGSAFGTNHPASRSSWDSDAFNQSQVQGPTLPEIEFWPVDMFSFDALETTFTPQASRNMPMDLSVYQGFDASDLLSQPSTSHKSGGQFVYNNNFYPGYNTFVGNSPTPSPASSQFSLPSTSNLSSSVTSFSSHSRDYSDAPIVSRSSNEPYEETEGSTWSFA